MRRVLIFCNIIRNIYSRNPVAHQKRRTPGALMRQIDKKRKEKPRVLAPFSTPERGHPQPRFIPTRFIPPTRVCSSARGRRSNRARAALLRRLRCCGRRPPARYHRGRAPQSVLTTDRNIRIMHALLLLLLWARQYNKYDTIVYYNARTRDSFSARIRVRRGNRPRKPV